VRTDGEVDNRLEAARGSPRTLLIVDRDHHVPYPVRRAFAADPIPSAMLHSHGQQPCPSPPPSALASVNAITGGGGLLQPHHHAVGRAAAIDHGEPHEAGPFRLEEQRAPSSRSPH